MPWEKPTSDFVRIYEVPYCCIKELCNNNFRFSRGNRRTTPALAGGAREVLPQYMEAPSGLSRLLADFHELRQGFIPHRAQG